MAVARAPRRLSSIAEVDVAFLLAEVGLRRSAMVYVGMTAVSQGIGCQILSGLDTYILDMKEIVILLSRNQDRH